MTQLWCTHGIPINIFSPYSAMGRNLMLSVMTAGTMLMSLVTPPTFSDASPPPADKMSSRS